MVASRLACGASQQPSQFIGGSLWEMSSSPEQQAALTLQRQAPSGKFLCHRSGCSAHSSPANAPKPQFLHYHRSAACFCGSYHLSPEAQPCRGSVSVSEFSSCSHMPRHLRPLYTLESLLTLLIVNYHLPNLSFLTLKFPCTNYEFEFCLMTGPPGALSIALHKRVFPRPARWYPDSRNSQLLVRSWIRVLLL